MVFQKLGIDQAAKRLWHLIFSNFWNFNFYWQSAFLSLSYFKSTFWKTTFPRKKLSVPSKYWCCTNEIKKYLGLKVQFRLFCFILLTSSFKHYLKLQVILNKIVFSIEYIWKVATLNNIYQISVTKLFLKFRNTEKCRQSSINWISDRLFDFVNHPNPLRYLKDSSNFLAFVIVQSLKSSGRLTYDKVYCRVLLTA